MKEFTNKSVEELKGLLSEKREALRVFRAEIIGGKTKNVRAGRELRTAIARILTVINASKA